MAAGGRRSQRVSVISRNEKFSAATEIFLSFSIKSTFKNVNFRCGLHAAVWKNAEFTLTGKIIRQISYLVLLVSKNVVFTKVLPNKCVRANVSNLHLRLCTVSFFHTVKEIQLENRLFPPLEGRVA